MHRTRIKICGITRQRDALAAIKLGADALGFVFYPSSSRYISVENAAKIAFSLPPMVSLVGVFVDAEADFIANVLASVPLTVLQFHGAETEPECVRWHKPYMKAVRVQRIGDVAEAEANYQTASALLLDTFASDQAGGTGKVFDWSLVPQNDKPLVLAGGLTPDNVADAIRQVQPYGVDVCGGVESAPGIKCPRLLQAFTEQAQQ